MLSSLLAPSMEWKIGKWLPVFWKSWIWRVILKRLNLITFLDFWMVPRLLPTLVNHFKWCHVVGWFFWSGFLSPSPFWCLLVCFYLMKISHVLKRKKIWKGPWNCQCFGGKWSSINHFSKLNVTNARFFICIPTSYQFFNGLMVRSDIFKFEDPGIDRWPCVW